MKKSKKKSSILSVVCIIALIAQIIIPGKLVLAEGQSYFPAVLVNNLAGPEGVAVDSAGNVYIADYLGNTIKKRDISGSVTILADANDGLKRPAGIAVDSAGNVYIADFGNNAIKKLDISGTLTTLVSAGLNGAAGVAVDSAGNVYIADSWNSSVKKLDTSGTLTTLPYSGGRDFDIAADSAGNVYIADIDNNTIKKLDTSGTLTTLVSGLNRPQGVAVDNAGNVYIADTDNKTIKKLDASGTLTTLADGLSGSNGLAVDNEGFIYISNYDGGTINKLLLVVPVSDFSNSSKTAATASFTWTTAIGAAGISIQQSPAGENTWATASTGTISNIAATATVTGLSAGTPYDFRLIVTGGANPGNSNVVTITTGIPPTTPILAADKTTPTNTDVTLTITYPADASIKQYKTNGGDWTNYAAPIVLSANDTIYAKCQNAEGDWSAAGSLAITNINKILPIITVAPYTPTPTNQDVVVTAATDKGILNTGTHTFIANGSFDFIATDEWGNITTKTVTITNIDKVNPSINVTGNPTSWTRNDVPLNISITKGISGVQSVTVQKDSGLITDITGQGTYTAEANGSYKFILTNGAGVIDTKTVDVTYIDKINPTGTITIDTNTWKEFLNKISFGLFYNNTVDVSIVGNDNLSGVKTIQYQKVADQSEYNANGTWATFNKLTVSPDEKFIVFAKITDNAGNFVIINSDGVIVDATKPAVILTPDTSDWTKYNVKVNVKVSDNLSGIKEVNFATDEKVPQTGTAVITGGEGNITLTNEGQYKLTVTAIDNSLNEISETLDIKIDKSLPVISSITGNPSDWTGDSITLTVNASDAMSGFAAQAYSFDGGVTWQAANAKTYDENIDGIVVKVIDKAGNIASSAPVNINKIDKTAPNTAVIENKDKYGEDKWFNETQTISASFTKTQGCDENLQYKTDDSVWTDGESVDVNAEGKHIVSFRVIDILGRTSEERTVNVNIDKTLPTNAKITVKDREFTSFLNKITFGLFFKNTVNVTIAGGSSISGIRKIEYQKISDPADYDANGTWTIGNSFSVSPDEKFIVYAKITDNAGNFVIINSDGVIVDATKPAVILTPDTSDWTKNNVKVSVKVSDNLSGIKEVNFATDEKVPQIGTAVITGGEGNIILTNEGQYKLTVTAIDNSLNEISQNIDIKIDRTLPTITGASDSSSYFVGRVINITDDLGEICQAAYKNGTDDETPFKDGDLFEKPGNYTLTLADKAGNPSELSFEIKSLPSLIDVVYTNDCKALIDTIRDEFNGHSDLLEAYKTDIDNEIKALEDKYSELDKEVIEIKADTNTIEGKVEKLPNRTDGLISLQKEIQNEYNKIVGSISVLTEEQKKALENEAEYLKQQLAKIALLQNQINNIKTQVSNVDTKEDGLISQEGKTREILSDIGNLTTEQQSILKPGIDLLNSLLSRIDTLKEQVKTVKDMINSIPSLDKITKQDAENINKINKLYNEFTKEQKELLGEDLIKQFNDTVEVLKKLMLYDADTDTTVTGIDGTSFTTDVYLVVTPIDKDTDAAGFQAASDNVEDASKYISAVKGKEILALYDVSLFRDGIKIQPDGKVKVKIKIPEGLRNRTGLDIIHIADNGTVTPMNAVVEGEYLVFITDHFSDYAIIAKTIAKEIPKTGSSIDFSVLSVIGVIFILGGLLVLALRRKK